ncbi:class I SAM-dependent methyltransferase [Winogradskyella jejuensis]|uniref:Methyltransferase domain-containing protein n=1 Tax=Winogradskyella jejuensis TaxID=1089305 RepID=A0A1M5JVN8_9FLAO|nr:class I SAM-dependent methyltransferase [Winogradskyella jejuensis]SHG44083.1 Methyltransferase domain-containing protein [Winogradskyella jejuensis]
MAKLSIIDKFHHWRRKRRWNKQYKKGKWDYLNNEREAVRYNKIVEYIKTYGTSKPVILDLGAGEAVLNERLNADDYTFFYNVDYSSASIEKAEEKGIANTKNLVADIHTYDPEETFDIIVFNEAFYYVHDHLKHEVLDRFTDKLSPKGVLITSIYKEGQNCWDIIDASPKLQQLNFETVNTDRESTYWKVGVYKRA